MFTLPQATTTIDDSAGAFSGSSDCEIVLAAVATSADITPRVFTSGNALLAQHGYCPGADYVALHVAATKKPVIFLGLPIVTAGAVTQQDTSGVTGTCTPSVAASTSAGVMEETFGTFTVTAAGTVGAVGIQGNLSLDGGRTTQPVRLGTASSYVIPYVGITISFGAGTLNVGDVFAFRTTAPAWGSTDFAAAFTALAGQQLLGRSVMVIGELADSTHAGYVTSNVDSYETADDRYVYARINVKDRLPLPASSRAKVAMVGAPSLTFIAGDTCTRATGSWLTDGLANGDVVTFTAAGGLNTGVTAVITTLTDTVLTASATTFAAETSTAYSVVGSPSLVFAASGHTVTRSAGSWITEGFAVGDSVTFKGTASNNVTATITALSATAMTFASGLANETVRSDLVSVTKNLTMSGWVSNMATAFSAVDGEKRIDIALGRGRVISPITGWMLRRPCAWAAAIREYQHSEQIPCWRKSDGPLLGWDLTDGLGNVVEYDERTVGGALANRFTCFRTWGNGPNGAFIAMSLTRDTDGSLLGLTHNMAVMDVAQTTCQAATENDIGDVLVLQSNGIATAESLATLAEGVNTQLQINLLQDQGEGALCSSAVWTPATDDVLNDPSPTLHGELAVLLDGVLVKIATKIVAQTAG